MTEVLHAECKMCGRKIRFEPKFEKWILFESRFNNWRCVPSGGYGTRSHSPIKKVYAREDLQAFYEHKHSK